MDDLDLRIMAELQEDGRRSYSVISERLGIAPGTVRSRVLQLVSDGVFQVIAVPDPWQMGYRFHATVALKCEPGHAERIGDLLAERGEVGWVGLMANGYDVMCEVTLPESRSFGMYREDVLAKLPGVTSIDSFTIWDVRKFNYRLLPPADVTTNGDERWMQQP
jgi:Lrp/AsnC family transcriptional regulator, regulator for asnA, asnC and gidA